MKPYVIPATALLCIALLFGCSEGMPEGEKIEYEEVQELIEEVGENKKFTVRGSCNVINEKSHCFDYIGSMWTEEQMRLNCEGGGTYSPDSCPYSENGGCRTTGGTIAEVIIWSYPHGGSPVSGEALQHEMAACNANPLGEWVLPMF